MFTSSPTIPGGQGRPVVTSRISRSAVIGPSEPSGVSGVRAMATPPSVDPNASMTVTANRRENRPMSRGAASLPYMIRNGLSASSTLSGVARM